LTNYRKVFLDFEARSPVNLKLSGAYRYAMHPQTEVMCLAYAFQGEKPKILTAKEVRDGAFVHILADPTIRLCAHSAHFEYAVSYHVLHKRFGQPAVLDPARWDDTMARCGMCGLPLKLEKAGIALDIEMKKDMEGKAALLKLCKLRGYDPLGDPIWNDDPALYEILYRYCIRDVEAEMEIDSRLPELPPFERRVFELDLIVNHRGVRTDLKMARNAASMADKLADRLNSKLPGLTGGRVTKATQIERIKDFLAEEHGLEVDSLDKASLSGLLANPEIPQAAKDLLYIRKQVGRTSTAKYLSALDVADPDDWRSRGLIQYHGAFTGRFAGRLLQPHNFPKGVSENFPKGMSAAEQERAIQMILDGDAWMFQLAYGDMSMEVLGNVLRGLLTAGPNGRLVVADFAAIEARVVLWLAGDEAALDKFRRGVSLYADMAEYIFKRPAGSVTKKDALQYALGKAAILGCGYGMGATKFQASCAFNGVHIDEQTALSAIRAYREKYRSVVNMWYSVERAAANAIRSPGTVHACCGGKVLWGMDKKREFLVCKLPSGRHLRYYRPKLAVVDGPRGEKEEIRYLAVGLNGEMVWTKTYGGSLVENITQAVARDLMVLGMLRCEDAGYPVVLTVHDEVVSDVPFAHLTEGGGRKSLEEFIKLLCEVPDWGAGCPVAAEGFVAERYRK
jgi:DNA polymerase